jgi:hypothetical protein
VKVNPVPLTGTISPLPQAGDELEAYISGEGSTSGSYVAGQSPVTLSSTSPGSFSVDVLVYGITSYNTSDVTAYIGYIPANSDGSPDYGGSPATVSNNCTFDLTGSTP